MSDALYVQVTVYYDEDDKCDWFFAQLYFNGEVVATGLAPNRDVYNRESVGPKSAVALAISKFCRTVGDDVRYIGCSAQGVIERSPQ